jgi:alkanesulfonate monooxygenase SsuD/methylene tetrahydromethanopterin reductase-like flavin-dependent oxidoreductase (luciferase family)
MSDMKFWYHLPAKEGVQFAMDCALKAEKVGFDVVSHMDHLLYVSKDRGSIPECWTMLTAVGVRTNLTVSPLVMCSLFRNPVLVAKMAATLDNLTQGRVYLGLGAGWWEDEFQAYGYKFTSAKDRVDRTIEAVQIIRSLWTGERVDFEGDFWTLKDCWLSPVPFDGEKVPIWNGGAGPRMLKMAGELCDGWIAGGGDVDDFVRSRDTVLGHSGGKDMEFGYCYYIREAETGFDGVGKKIEELSAVGVTNFILIISPDSRNLELLDTCGDLIGDFR